MRKRNERRSWWWLTAIALVLGVFAYRRCRWGAASLSDHDRLASQREVWQAGGGADEADLASRGSNPTLNASPVIVLEEALVLRSGDVITLKTDEGRFMQWYDAFPPNSSYIGIIAWSRDPNPFCYFTVEVVSANHIRLRTDNGYYITRSCCWKDHPFLGILSSDDVDDNNDDDDKSVFAVVTFGNGTIKLQTKDGKYVAFDSAFVTGFPSATALVIRGDVAAASLGVSRIVNAEGALVVNPNLFLYNGDKIAIRTNDGAFWRRVHPFVTVDYSGIVAQLPASHGGDQASEFEVEVVASEEFHLLADDGGYLMRYCCWNAQYVLAVFRTWAQASARFKLIPVGGRQVQLEADNRMFWLASTDHVTNPNVDAAIIATRTRSGSMAHNFFIDTVHLRGVLVRHSFSLVSDARVSFIDHRRFVLSYGTGSSVDHPVPTVFVPPSHADADAVFRVHVVSQSQAQFLTQDGSACLAPRCCLEDGRPFFGTLPHTHSSTCVLFVVPLGGGKILLRASNGDYLNIAQTSQNQSALVPASSPDFSGILYIAVH